jgi:uncharacterized protein (DUF1697 family)
MDSLRELYAGLNFSAIRTYVQSGNVIFQTSDTDPSELSGRIETRIQETYGYRAEVFIWQVDDFHHMLSENPFFADRHEDPTKLHVTFLYRNPPDAAWKNAIPPAGIPDEFARAYMAVYLFCPNGYGKTRLSNVFFERKLGVPATTRNWNTVNMLYKMAQE